MTWSDEALEGLRAAGLRRGGARRAVVEFLEAQDCCRSAQEIHDGIAAKGGAVGVASVYRALDTLADLRLVQRVDVGDGIARFRNAYLAKPDGPASLVPATLIAQAGRAAELAGVLLADRTATGPHAATSLQNHLHYAKQYEAAARVGELIHDDGRASKAQTAFETACSWAQAGDPDKGLDWLRQAVSDGFTAASMIDGEPDLAPVRALPAFDDLRSRLT